MLPNILAAFGLDTVEYKVEPFGSGLINYTFRVSGNSADFILQKINANVFKSPVSIADNLALLQAYFQKTHPDYLFVGPLPTVSGEYLVRDAEGEYYRLFPFVKGSATINSVSNAKEAFEASRQFGLFTGLLNNFDVTTLQYTLPNFHNLGLRFAQFKTAFEHAEPARLHQAAAEIKQVHQHYNILESYQQLIANNEIPVRVIHHDTKISNVLFDGRQNGLCVIDLDTVMPGYYISDVGDMMRTYLSPANEEETDLSKIQIREDIFTAICKGYMLEMGEILTETEKQYFIFSGKFIIYMQAIRFLTDFLNNDIYYGIKYAGHNLARAKNQFDLLNKYVACEATLMQLFISAQQR